MSLRKVQTAAAQTVEAVWAGKNLNEFMNTQRAQLHTWRESERAAWMDIAYGCQRYGGVLQFYLRKMVPSHLSNILSEALLIVALYQLAYTENAPHAVVHEAVHASEKIAKGKFKSLTNAVLRRFLREHNSLLLQAAQNLEAHYNFPLWWINTLKHDYPQDWEKILETSQQHPPMTLRINCRHSDALNYLNLLHAADLDGEVLSSQAIRLNRPVAVSRLPYFEQGWVSVQDLGAQQAALLLAPRDGEYILDACAAPGGKSTHLLEIANCTLTALDIDKQRLNKVDQNLKRLNFKATLKCADVTQLSQWYSSKTFDAILADVPCTASGIVRRHPDIKWLRQQKDAVGIAAQQRIILDVLWSCLKTEGRMLLSTCSIFKEENQQQIHSFLQRNKNALLLEELQILPSKNTDGFYYALLRKS